MYRQRGGVRGVVRGERVTGPRDGAGSRADRVGLQRQIGLEGHYDGDRLDAHLQREGPAGNIVGGIGRSAWIEALIRIVLPLEKVLGVGAIWLGHQNDPAPFLVTDIVGLERRPRSVDLDASPAKDLEQACGASCVGLARGHDVGERRLIQSGAQRPAPQLAVVAQQLAPVTGGQSDDRAGGDHLIVDDVADAPPTARPRVRIVDAKCGLAVQLAALLKDR